MPWYDDSWKDTYDNWKLQSPYDNDDEPPIDDDGWPPDDTDDRSPDQYYQHVSDYYDNIRF